MPSAHGRAVLLALAVTVLWSTSWVLIKIALPSIPALTFAGLRYALAWVCLAAVALARPGRPAPTRAEWGRLALLGVLFYAVTQGAQFLGLAALPAAAVGLLLNLTPAFVALGGIVALGERPAPTQWLGMTVFLAGAALFFLPVRLSPGQWRGIGIVLAGVAANAASSVLGREVNRSGRLDPLTVTAVSMGIGAAILLAAGVIVQGLPPIGARTWAIIVWLAVVNTAIAFTLWNRTLRRLGALESSLLNGTMLIQIALLAWVVLGEALGPRQIVGLLLGAAGALLVQWRRTPAPLP